MTNNFKQYRNRESGNIFYGELTRINKYYFFAYKAHDKLLREYYYLTKKHFNADWEEINNDK